MAIEQRSVRDIVDRAVSNTFGMPEFQRGFVWTPNKVMQLVESLYQDYPIGALLLWRQRSDDTPASARIADAAQTPEVWVVDGQQRTTAMCLLFGRRPYWWKDNGTDWNKAMERNNIHVSPIGPEVDFVTPTRSVLRNDNFISVREVLNANDEQIEQIAERMHEKSPSSSAIAILRRLQRINDIGNRQIVAFEESKEIEETVEIFVRLNQRGTRVNEGDIVKAQVAAQNPTWVSNTLQPFIDELEDFGFDLEPTLIFRSLIASATGHTRFRNVEEGFWSTERLNQEWPKVEEAWRNVIKGLNHFGILNSDILPSKNALIPPVSMAAHFNKEFRIEAALGWLLRATCTNRYSRTTDTRLAEDVRAIREGNEFSTSVHTAIDQLDGFDFSEKDFFKSSYNDGAVRLMLYLLAYGNNAHDWSSSNDRIGFAGADLLQKFNPDWHHVFPRAYLRGDEDAYENVNCAANIVAIRKETNLKIGKKAPMEYMEGISDKLLREQYVPTDRSLFVIEKYDKFVEQRAAMLAKAANEFMAKLMAK